MHNRNYIVFITNYIVFLGCFVASSYFDISNLFATFYLFVLFGLINHFMVDSKSDRTNNLHLLLFYYSLSVLLYIFNLSVLPSFKGFTGPPGIGTDDCRFYYSITKFTDLPAHCKVIGDHNFAKFLKFLYPFPILNPLNLIFVNLLGITFVPSATVALTKRLFPGMKGMGYLYLMVALCPMLISNGIILMRDAWVALFLVLGLSAFVVRKFVPFILSASFLVVLRPGSAFLLIGILAFFLIKVFETHRNSKIIKPFLLVSAVVACAVLYPFLETIMSDEGISGFYREGFVEGYLSSERGNSSTLYQLTQLPMLLRIPALFFFFLLAPVVNFKLYTSATFDNLTVPNPRSFITSVFLPIFFIFHSKFFFNGFATLFRKGIDNYKRLMYGYLFAILLLSQLSMQFRHKVQIMPFFYVIIIVGINSLKEEGRTNLIAKLGFILVLFLNILFLIV